jgi:hypothetical protein
MSKPIPKAIKEEMSIKIKAESITEAEAARRSGMNVKNSYR